MSAFLRCEDLYKTYILRRRRAWLDGDDDEEDADDEAERGDEDRERRLLEQPEDGKPKREQPVLRGVTFEAHAGEVIGVVGVAGCGKSTLLDILARKTLPTSGRVEGKGLVIGFRDFQRPIAPIFSARLNLRFIAALHGFGKTAVAPLIEEAAAAVGAAGYLDVRASRVPQPVFADLGTLFGLLLRPDVLLLDDVRTLVSTRIRSAFPERFAQYLAETPCLTLIATNKTTVVERYATRAIWLHEGKVHMDGDAESVLDGFAQFQEEVPAQAEPGPRLPEESSAYTVADASGSAGGPESERWIEAMADAALAGGQAAAEEPKEERATLAEMIAALPELAFERSRQVPYGHRLAGPLADAVASAPQPLERVQAADGTPAGVGFAIDKPLGDFGRVLAAYVNTPANRGVVSVMPEDEVEIETLVQTWRPDVAIVGRTQYAVSVFEEMTGKFSNYVRLAKSIALTRFEARQPGVYSLRMRLPASFMGQVTRLAMCKTNLSVRAEPLSCAPAREDAAPEERPGAPTSYAVRWAIRGDLRADLSWDSQKKGKKPYAALLRPELEWQMTPAGDVPDAVLAQSPAEAETHAGQAAADEERTAERLQPAAPATEPRPTGSEGG